MYWRIERISKKEKLSFTNLSTSEKYKAFRENQIYKVVLTPRLRVDRRVRASEVVPHHWMQFSVIPRTPC